MSGSVTLKEPGLHNVGEYSQQERELRKAVASVLDLGK
jgi:hypothetical protein